MIDWELFRPELESLLGYDNRDLSKGGRPPFDPVFMLKVLVLQKYHNLSDEQTEFQIGDRFSFMQFLGLQPGDSVPDEKTIWDFKWLLDKDGHDGARKLFECFASQLSGWDCPRRVVIYRRAHTRKAPPKKPDMALEGTCAQQAESINLELVEDAALTYEYAVYVTNLERDVSQLRGLYNPRGDNENCYDELKNQWGWGGFTLRNLARSELMANLVALIYNLWSVYIKLVDPLVAREAITFRPMYLMHPAKVSEHSRSSAPIAKSGRYRNGSKKPLKG